MLEAAEKISLSRLAYWQNLDAMNLFVVSKASFHLDASALNVTWDSKLDANIR